MIKLIEDGTMSSKIAKKVFPQLAAKGGNAKQIMEDNEFKFLMKQHF